MTATLFDLNEGEISTVRRINASGSIRQRLLDLGLIEGTTVECVLRSRGDIAAYLIRGALIALRSEDSRTVAVEEGVYCECR